MESSSHAGRFLRHHNYSGSAYYVSSHAHNYTITTSVTIRVTPREDYLVSWGILWFFFVLTCLLAVVHLRKEALLEKLATESDQSSGGDEGGLSSAHRTRAMFCRLLLAAMLSRCILMPVQIEADPIWWQFVSDSFPEMLYASAWTCLVSFFVQLVGLAMGYSSSPDSASSSSIVMQGTAYTVYVLLIILQLWNQVATLLMYTLLCCIYCSLLGTTVYYIPKLSSLLHLNRRLYLRLAATCFVLAGLFAMHTVGYARLVVAPPVRVSWWSKYGVLELAPSLFFLILLHPQTALLSSSSSSSVAPIIGSSASKGLDDEEDGIVKQHSNAAVRASTPPIRRVDSVGSTGALGAASARRETSNLKMSVSASAGSIGSNYGATST